MGRENYNKKEELVSIIMPTYNSENYIRFSIESVTKQTYKNFELIIVDDCSTDNTGIIVSKYKENDSRIKYIKLEINSGAAAARNEGVHMAIGTYIAFLDSDDIWINEKLEKQIGFMKKNNYTFTCTAYNKIDETGNTLKRIVHEKEKKDYYGLLKNCPGNSTVIYNAKILGKFKIPNIKKRNDYLMWLQVIKKSGFLYGINETLSSHRIRKGSISSNKFSLLKYHWIIYRKIEKLSLTKSVFISNYWILKSVFKFNYKQL